MNKQDRAKQFLPFEALNGLRQALEEVDEELSKVEKIELSEEEMGEISGILQKIDKGRKVEVTFYEEGHYYTVVDTVTAIDHVFKFLKFATKKIFYDDIFAIRINL